MKKIYLPLSLTVALVATAAISPVLASDNQGLSIMQERKLRDTGWRSSEATLAMHLTNAQGQTSTRNLRMKNLEVAGDGDKSLSIFDTPHDVQGTAFLSFSHVTGADDQWLYLPALKRVKRIASRNKSGPFMGSEFAYEDLSSFEVEKYRYQYLGEADIGGEKTWKIENIPTDQYSGYSKLITWIDQQHYRVLKTEYYDRKSALLKTLTFSDYQAYEVKQETGDENKRFWRANLLAIENHQTGKSTKLNFSEYRFDTGLTEADFNKSKLKRAR
ncbi:outer membrane lipoprotein-sorting protein [Motilimonas sp. E26]|uniref:outer membrane lipoprotein-sorting protein n=1 Tax=Motilimonas TaxID=1914248 RepID=UPI001E336361|nr:outer membrane lipoprotein-sorting protein [Motilimonas sp. E26]MCE0556520.1 outer membrane lipoprotein-sorting protein [Motilimonas sp. E26]